LRKTDEIGAVMHLFIKFIIMKHVVVEIGTRMKQFGTWSSLRAYGKQRLNRAHSLVARMSDPDLDVQDLLCINLMVVDGRAEGPSALGLKNI